MAKPEVVVDTNKIDDRRQKSGEQFDARIKDVSDQTKLEKLGIRIYEIPPGKTAWPYHCHLANEEIIYIQEGRGTLRVGEEECSVGPGDLLAFPADPDYPHQLINTTERKLEYLCVSTMIDPDAMIYPDSNKIGILSGAPPGGESQERNFEKFIPSTNSMDYWKGEGGTQSRD